MNSLIVHTTPLVTCVSVCVTTPDELCCPWECDWWMGVYIFETVSKCLRVLFLCLSFFFSPFSNQVSYMLHGLPHRLFFHNISLSLSFLSLFAVAVWFLIDWGSLENEWEFHGGAKNSRIKEIKCRSKRGRRFGQGLSLVSSSYGRSKAGNGWGGTGNDNGRRRKGKRLTCAELCRVYSGVTCVIISRPPLHATTPVDVRAAIHCNT